MKFILSVELRGFTFTDDADDVLVGSVCYMEYAYAYTLYALACHLLWILLYSVEVKLFLDFGWKQRLKSRGREVVNHRMDEHRYNVLRVGRRNQHGEEKLKAGINVKQGILFCRSEQQTGLQNYEIG